jgi:hypothetical protein
MKRLFSPLAVVLLCVSVLSAATYVKYESITVAATAIGFTAANINNTDGTHQAATQAVCRLETAQIRWMVDGTTTVTATTGTLLEIGDSIYLTDNDVLNRFRAIRTGSTSGALKCTYSRP